MNRSRYTFRHYRDGDATQLSILFDLFQDELAQLDPLHRLQRQPGYGAAMVAKTLDDVARHEGVWCVVAHEDQLIAFAAGTIQRPTQEELLSLLPSSRGRVTELYVNPSYRGQGIGTQLLDAIELYCIQHGCDVARIEVFAPNRAARQFYEKWGYHERDIDLIKPIREELAMRMQDIVSLHLSDVIFPAEHPLAGQTGVVNAFALRHERRVVLIDTGVGFGNAEIQEYYQPVSRRLGDVFVHHGLRLTDVSFVINTHLHFDHCGQNHLFPSTPIYIQGAEYEAAHQPDFTIVEWVDFPGARYEQVNGDVELLPGIRVIGTPGHTAGHQSVIIETEEGHVVISGQAVYSASDYEQLLNTSRLASDPRPQALASAMRLVELHPRRVLFSHDDAVWDRGD